MDSNTELAEVVAFLTALPVGEFPGKNWDDKVATAQRYIDALTQQPADHIPDASNMVPAERADDWQNPILTSDPRPPKNQLKPAPLSSLRVVPAEQIADGALGVTQRDIHLAEAILSGARGFAVRIGPEHSAAKWAARHAQQARAQGQAEGQAAVLCWLRERGALKPPGSLWSAAATLADQFEATQLPACALQPHGQGGGE